MLKPKIDSNKIFGIKVISKEIIEIGAIPK